MQNLFFNLINVTAPEKCQDQAGFARATEDGLLKRAAVLRDIFQPICHYYNEHEVFQDVYAAAIYISLSSIRFQWTYNSATPRYFRGQRRNWSLVPSILRDDASSDDIAAAIIRLTKFVRTLQRDRDITDEQAVAIAQHYSSRENGLRTWLLDVTRDPLVALFFASLNGRTGEHGLLWTITEQEWNRLAGGGSNLLGAIRSVEVPNIHRIWAQKGLFIDTSHPELFDQYVPFTIKFQQFEGLIFEDALLDSPITRKFLLQDDDDLTSIIEQSTNFNVELPLACPHPVTPLRTLTGQDYLEIVTSWVQNNPIWTIDDERQIWLRVLCIFHAKLQALPADAENDPIVRDLTVMRSLHNLWRGVEMIFLPFPCDLLVDNYLVRTGNPSLTNMVCNIAEEVSRECGLVWPTCGNK